VKWSSGAALACLATILVACDNMANQAKLKPYELPYGSELHWPVKPPPNTVARDDALKPPSAPPLTMALLERGKQRFDINCAPCHSRTGDGNGIIVQRGFPRPPSYHSEELRRASNDHLYDVVTRGHGVMFSYADRVEPSDRWAIIAYIRALQASTNATVADVPAGKRDAL
jgi:mono/diheme cytochrome c family protein